jgi:hypothetical protein
MFLNSVVNVTRFFLASVVLMLAMPQAGLSEVTSSQVINDEAIEALDEIVVFGEPPLRLLRDEVYAAEENFYELFNTLNNGRQFDVQCFYRKPVGSHIPRRMCEAYFVKNSSVGSFLGGGGVPHWAFIRHKTKQMLKEMAALVEEQPELHAALLEFEDAKQIFDSSLHDRCVNRIYLCRKQTR